MLTKRLRAFYAEHMEEEAMIKAINMKFLQIFYLTPYDTEDFYQVFDGRVETMKNFLESMKIC
jgi:hypothetical protein